MQEEKGKKTEVGALSWAMIESGFMPNWVKSTAIVLAASWKNTRRSGRIPDSVQACFVFLATQEPE